MKKILIAGGTGFLGKELELYFKSHKYPVYILTRNPTRNNEYYWDARTLGDWTKILEKCDILINLTGKSVDCRYTAKNKKEILDSRVQSTTILAKAIQKNNKKPELWINSSSATIYEHSLAHCNTEENGVIGDDFSMNVCKAWENAFFETAIKGTRKVAARVSIVMGESGGALPLLRSITKLGVGGKQGAGNQMISWVRIEDFCRAVHFIIENQLSGPVNIATPVHFTNKSFMKSLRKHLRRPIGIPLPAWLLELGMFVIRSETELLLKSRFVCPEKLLNAGFAFESQSPFEK